MWKEKKKVKWKMEEQRNVGKRRTTYCGKAKNNVLLKREEQRDVEHQRT